MRVTPTPRRFLSDNTATVCPEILAALTAANEGLAVAYGDDPWTQRLDAVLGDFFGTEVRAFAVATGTAANSLSLATLSPPYGAIFAHEEAHVVRDECGAPEFFSGGARLILVRGEHGRISSEALTEALASYPPSVHTVQLVALSLTQATEFGTAYRPADIAALSAIAHRKGLKVHMDGARFANAVGFLGCHPSEVTWRAGVDVLSLGATKNGALSAEAIVAFDDRIAEELVYRTKRSGHVTSKLRFQSAQVAAYLTDGLWLRLASSSNRRMAELVAELEPLASYGVRLAERVDVNMAFVELPAAAIDAATDAGVLCYRMSETSVRLVTSWQTTADDVTRAAATFRDAVAAVAPS